MRQRVVCMVSDPMTQPSIARVLAADGLRVSVQPLSASIGGLALSEPDVVLIDGSRDLTRALGTCRQVTQALGLPVVLWIALPSPATEVLCLAAGARQVVVTRDSDRLVVARVRAALPRPIGEIAPLVVGPLRLDRAARHLQCHERGVDLARSEFAILASLMEHPRQVLPRAALMRVGWDCPCSDRALESTLSRLRRKVLGAGGPRVAVPVRGVGYRLGLEGPAGR